MTKLDFCTLGVFLHRQAERCGAREALVQGDHRMDYAGLLEASGLTAQKLLTAGVRKGRHVALLMNDGPQQVVLLFALWRIGAVPVPLCTSLTLPELENSLRLANVEMLLIDDECRGVFFPELCRELTAVAQDRIITVGPLGAAEYTALSTLPPAAEEALRAAEGAVTPEDDDLILFTSGSTGSSKPVLTSHFNRVNTMLAQAAALDADENDRFCSVLPMYHCFSLTAVVLAALAVGACLCFPQSRHTTDILETIEKERCTVLTAVPTLFSALLRRQREQKADIHTLRTGMIGGSHYPAAFFRQICEELDYALLPSLGQTEATAGITSGGVTDSLSLRSETIGKPFPGVSVCIRAQDGTEQHRGQAGELCIRGFNVMRGYYRQPEATRAVLDPEGWLHTGDMARLDSQGFLRYAGRLKELIIRGGENIYPGELEEILLVDPRIADCRVLGVPDPHYMEEICACVVSREAITAEEVRELLRGKVSYFKIPRYVLFFDALPLLPSGKPDRRRLASLVQERIGEQKCL